MRNCSPKRLSILIPSLLLLTNFQISSAQPGDPPGTIPLIPMATEAEVIVPVNVGTNGFTPSQTVRPEGQILFSFKNSSGLNNLEMRIDKVGGKRLREFKLRIPPKKNRYLEQIYLMPGDYVITEANHPDWKLTLKVISR
jgi:hypothetical protein